MQSKDNKNKLLQEALEAAARGDQRPDVKAELEAEEANLREIILKEFPTKDRAEVNKTFQTANRLMVILDEWMHAEKEFGTSETVMKKVHRNIFIELGLSYEAAKVHNTIGRVFGRAPRVISAHSYVRKINMWVNQFYNHVSPLFVDPVAMKKLYNIGSPNLDSSYPYITAEAKKILDEKDDQRWRSLLIALLGLDEKEIYNPIGMLLVCFYSQAYNYETQIEPIYQAYTKTSKQQMEMIYEAIYLPFHKALASLEIFSSDTFHIIELLEKHIPVAKLLGHLLWNNPHFGLPNEKNNRTIDPFLFIRRAQEVMPTLDSERQKWLRVLLNSLIDGGQSRSESVLDVEDYLSLLDEVVIDEAAIAAFKNGAGHEELTVALKNWMELPKPDVEFIDCQFQMPDFCVKGNSNEARMNEDEEALYFNETEVLYLPKTRTFTITTTAITREMWGRKVHYSEKPMIQFSFDPLKWSSGAAARDCVVLHAFNDGFLDESDHIEICEQLAWFSWGIINELKVLQPKKAQKEHKGFIAPSANVPFAEPTESKKRKKTRRSEPKLEKAVDTSPQPERVVTEEIVICDFAFEEMEKKKQFVLKRAVEKYIRTTNNSLAQHLNGIDVKPLADVFEGDERVLRYRPTGKGNANHYRVLTTTHKKFPGYEFMIGCVHRRLLDQMEPLRVEVNKMLNEFDKWIETQIDEQ